MSEMTENSKMKKPEAKTIGEKPILLIDKQLRKFKTYDELLHLAERLFQKEPSVCMKENPITKSST